MTAIEAFANAAIGFAVSWAATFFVLGYAPHEALGVTLMFFALSFARSYLIRRLFAWLS